MSDKSLAQVADQLYAGPQATFTASRDAAAKSCADSADRADGADRDLARQVKALRKPTVAAWAVNLLVRRETEQIDQVLGMAAQLRTAAADLDGPELRALTRQRRQLTTALASSARLLAREFDVRLTEAVVDQVEGVLNAAMLDPVAADVVRTGLLVAPFTATGLGELDVAGVVAVPEALGARATPVVKGPPELHVVPDTEIKREMAREAVEAAAAVVARAVTGLAGATRQLDALNAKRLQLQGEIDELRRRVGALEDQVEQVDDELEEAQDAEHEVAEELEEARRAHADAQRQLGALE
ncbi:MAG: hypothetical protein M3130_07105 [Actinomycetota bacterium]|nr:hypothetical protein [Actinomycetota bacterium]